MVLIFEMNDLMLFTKKRPTVHRMQNLLTYKVSKTEQKKNKKISPVNF